MSLRELVATRSARMSSALKPSALKQSTPKQVGVVVALFLTAFGFDAALAERHGFFDLKVYYGALNYWADGTGEIYDYLLPATKYGFTYPPFAALTMLPMAYVGWHVAIGISAVLTAGAAAAVLYLLVAPMARRYGWSRWFAFGVAVSLAIAFEPMRETFLFGQVNAVLLLLVAADLLLLVRYNRSFAGVGIGIATAIKLTPGIFIVYLIITRRYRAAAVASGTMLAATMLAAAVAPDASREYWTDALWNTSRVGSQAFVSNQSLSGVIHRWDPDQPATFGWLTLVLLVFAVWTWRSRRAARRGDEATGLALTGLVGVLISPITWIHHLVWVLPALVVLVDRGLAAGLSRRRRWWLLGLAGVTYAIMCSRIVWAFNGRFESFGGWLGSNTYVWLSLILLVVLPLAQAAAPAAIPRTAPPLDSAPDLVELDERLTAIINAKPERVPGADERRLVGAEHP